MAEGINIFKLITAWYAFKEENDLSGNHTDVFFFCVDLNNQLAWKEVFGLPTMASSEFLKMSPNTFRKVLNDLDKLNVVKVVKRAKNQLTANQVTIAKAYQNLLKLRKSDYTAFVKAQQQQLNTSCAIDIHLYNNTLIQLDNLKKEKEDLKNRIAELENENKKTKQVVKQKKQYNPTVLEITEIYLDLGANGQSESFAQITSDFLIWKKEQHKDKYKTKLGLKKHCEQLLKFSGRNIGKASEIYAQTYANNWKGIFNLNQKGSSGQYLSQRERDKAEDEDKRRQLVELMEKRADQANKEMGR